ncbi:MAG: TonB-dependent receptor [Novosphingobium sp.]|uniref:TonB-dependent receptor plug domain-containing protein n=1 Tax=Novosphingobium sp. TaxID=1874826 RepID=UPI0032B7732E
MKYLFYIGSFLSCFAPAVAQEQVEDDGLGEIVGVFQRLPDTAADDSITVLATGQRGPIDRTGQSISIVTADELEQVQGPDITRVLERLPGVTSARSGPLGSQTSLFVRGANSEQLLVLIDGVRMADQAAPSGGFDLGTLLPAGIGRIELLRGSNSVVWGSDAMGGVLAVESDTRAGPRVNLEYGAHGTLVASAGGRVGGGGSWLAVNGGYARSDGISAKALGSEADPFRQWHGSASGRLALGGDLALVASTRYADSTIDFDGYPAPAYVFADTPEYQTTRQASGRAGLDYAGSTLRLAGGIALSDTRRAYFDPTYGAAPNFTTAGRSLRADLTGRADLSDSLALDFGADSEWTRYSTTFDARQNARLTSGHALVSWNREALSLSAGARIDDHDRFGSHWTFGANGAVRLGGGWRLRAAWGQGFKAPTLSQLYGYGANPLLRPEESESIDAGIERGDRNAPLHLALTLFRRDSRDLIGYTFPNGYFNTARARAEGIELEGGAHVSDRFAVRAAYSYVKVTNRVTGTALARRPRHAVSLSADWRAPLADLALGIDLRMVSDSFDDPANFQRIDGHALMALRASLPLGDHFELYGRVENVTDARYETAAGYGTYGRSAYAGVRLTW